MQTQSYLMFRHRDSLYGMAAHHVRELFPLPELTPLADAPQDIIGSLNWRGKLLPVMHLDRRLGQPPTPCQLTDTVIVMEWQGIQVGMVVNQMLEVQTFDASVLEPVPTYGREQQINTAFLAGMAKQEADVVMLLQPETLIREPDAVATRIWEAELFNDTPNLELDDAPEENSAGEITPVNSASLPAGLQAEWQHYVSAERVLTNFYDLYCPDATASDREVFRQRAAELRVPIEDSDLSERLSLAVIGWGEELFGIELGLVREFITVNQQVIPIPCCPPHIVGNMNLRGEIMTLVDIRGVLDIPPAAPPTQKKAIVVDVDDVVAGIPVDEVVDVAYISPTEVTAMPTTGVGAQRGYLQGIAKYQDLPISILNLPTILTKGGVSVDQVA